MTLRTAAHLGVAGSAMPFAGIASWFVAAAVAGQPLPSLPFTASVQLAIMHLESATVFGFFVMLYLVSAGHAKPSRLGDAALAASVLAMAALAVSLRWTVFPNLFSGLGHDVTSWMIGTHWRTSFVLVPVAWLVFLVSLVRWPAPPLARGSRRAAGWLGLFMAVAGAWPIMSFAGAVTMFFLDYPARGLPSISAWMAVISTFIESVHWVLLCIFALAVWRMKPDDEPSTPA